MENLGFHYSILFNYKLRLKVKNKICTTCGAERLVQSITEKGLQKMKTTDSAEGLNYESHDEHIVKVKAG